MKLSHERIQELASQPGVKRIAVENFLSTLGSMTYQEAKMNLEMDARSYRWNDETVSAIWQGLLDAQKGEQ